MSKKSKPPSTGSPAAGKAPPPILYDCWSNNYRRADDGYTGHAWMEGLPRMNRTLCGVEIQEIGETVLKGKEEIGCRRCKRSRFLKQ